MSARPLAPFLISFALLLLVLATPVAAQSETVAPRGGDEEIRSRLLAAVSHDLINHFNVEGDLQLEPLRP